MKNYIFGIVILSTSIILAGCAGTAGRHRVLVPTPESVSIGQYANLILDTHSTNGEVMTENDFQRIKALIIKKIKEKQFDRFKQINSENNMPHSLHASLDFEKYDKGNAFARSMLIGLGQIHIDAILQLSDNDTQEVLGKFEIKKTFAWGGLYGGFTGIEGAEYGFADAVVEVLFEEE